MISFQRAVQFSQQQLLFGKRLPPADLFQIDSEKSANNTRVDKQYDHRSDERHKETCGVAFLVHAGLLADETSQPRTDDAQKHRQDQTHMLPAWHHSASHQTNNQSEDGVSNHV
jgi:hypothetical protein